MKIAYNVITAGATVDGEDLITSVRAVPADQAVALGVIDLQFKNVDVSFEAGGTFTIEISATKSRADVKAEKAKPVEDEVVVISAELLAEASVDAKVNQD